MGINDLHALHRYFIWANRLREYFDAALAGQGVLGSTSPTDFVDDKAIFMSYWYAGLSTVIEGYQELRINDSSVDAILTSPNVALLKRYRNGVAHFQKDYSDERFLNLLSASDAANWVRTLNREMGRVLIERLRAARAPAEESS